LAGLVLKRKTYFLRVFEIIVLLPGLDQLIVHWKLDLICGKNRDKKLQNQALLRVRACGSCGAKRKLI
jgi:hypothetical protein